MRPKSIEYGQELAEPAEQAQTDSGSNKPKREFIYAKMKPFDKSHPSYSRERHLALSRKGGEHSKPACKALRVLLSKQQKKFAMGTCKCTYREAFSFYHLLLSFENFKQFAQSEMLELLALMKYDTSDELRLSTCLNPNGSVKYISSPGRNRVIDSKIRRFELLLKAGKAFFPEMKDATGVTLNYLRTDTPLDMARHPDLKLVSTLTPEAKTDAASVMEKPSESSASGGEKKKSSKVIPNE